MCLFFIKKDLLLSWNPPSSPLEIERRVRIPSRTDVLLGYYSTSSTLSSALLGRILVLLNNIFFFLPYVFALLSCFVPLFRSFSSFCARVITLVGCGCFAGQSVMTFSWQAPPTAGCSLFFSSIFAVFFSNRFFHIKMRSVIL